MLNEPSGQNSRKSKKNKFDEGCSSTDLLREEKVEIKAIMNAFGKVPELSVLLDHALFSMMLLKKRGE